MIFDTSTASVGQGSHVFVQPDLPLPVDPLNTLNAFKRATSEQIAPCFLNTAEYSRETRKALDLLDCSNTITLSRDGNITAHRRCRKRVCATCSHIVGKAWSKRLHEAVKLLPNIMLDEPIPADKRDDNDRAIGLKLTLNAGELCSLDELRDVTRMLHRLWPRLQNIKPVKGHVLGSFRATEATISHTPSTDPDRVSEVLANPHIHGLLMLSPPDDADPNEWIKTVSDKLTRYWSRSVKSQLVKMGVKDRRISSAAQLIEPLIEHTPHDVASWLSYASKGASQGLARQLKQESFTSTYEELVEVWTKIDIMLNSVHLISSSGSIKEALKHQEESDRISMAEERRDRDEGRAKKPRATHKWSTPKRRYIPIDEWTPEIDMPLGWQINAMRLSHLAQPKQLFNALRVGRDKEILSDKQRILHHAKFGELLPSRRDDI